MNAVWLNEDLMVSPAAVVGLVCRSEDDSYMNYWTHVRVIDVVLLGGDRLRVWASDVDRINPLPADTSEWGAVVGPGQARTKAAAEAEMERLSVLLWPPEPERRPKRCSGYVGDLRCVRDDAHSGEHSLSWQMPMDIRIYDPELYGLPVCGVERSYAGVIVRCDLAANHHLAGRPEHRFPDADPL